QGGGWLGAQGSHAVDQVRSTLGEFAGVSSHLPVPTDRAWTAEDGYLVNFRLRNGVAGVLQSTANDRGPFLVVSRVVGTTGTVWAEWDNVWLADADGTHEVPVPDDLRPAPPDPPPV